MKEIAEFRVPEEKAVKYLQSGDGVTLAGHVRKLSIPLQDPLVRQIVCLHQDLREKGDYFYLYSNIHREYKTEEIAAAKALKIVIRRVFEPTGEECGTLYSDIAACKYCGAGSEQASDLILDPRSLPDPTRLCIAKTISGEIIVSHSFRKVCRENAMRGAEFQDIWQNKKCNVTIPEWFQLKIVSPALNIVAPTRAGTSPFDDGCMQSQQDQPSDEVELPGTWCDRNHQYVCPLGHTIGLNLFSELSIEDQQQGLQWDIAVTRQLIGVRRGLLRPEPLLVCSSRFRKCMSEARLKGMSFEVVHLV
jgi:hypothetical protein